MKIMRNMGLHGLVIGLFVFHIQNSLAQTFICDSISPKSEGALFAAAIQLKECLEEISDIDQAKEVVQVLTLDVIKYYDLGRLYDTEEKMNAFKQTRAYKDSLAALTAVKKEKLNGYYYSILTYEMGKFSWSFKGYKFEMDKLSTPGGTVGAPPPPGTMFYYVDLYSLPFTLTPPRPGQEGGPDQHMIINVEPDNGMKIDRDKVNVKIVVVYKLDRVVEKEYNFFNAQCHCNRNAKQNVIMTKNNRIIVYNTSTNEVYLDKNF